MTNKTKRVSDLDEPCSLGRVLEVVAVAFTLALVLVLPLFANKNSKEILSAVHIFYLGFVTFK